MPTPGDVVLLSFPGVQGVKPRPGIVVSSGAYHAERPDVVVALCTSNVAAATTAIDYVLLDWATAGLRVPTAYRSFFTTLPVTDVHRLIGHVTDRDWDEIKARLRLALEVT